MKCRIRNVVNVENVENMQNVEDKIWRVKYIVLGIYSVKQEVGNIECKIGIVN